MACEDCTVVFSEEVVVDAGETQGVELVTMTTKEHIFLPCNCVQQEIQGLHIPIDVIEIS
jgi:hypothetical protein